MISRCWRCVRRVRVSTGFGVEIEDGSRQFKGGGENPDQTRWAVRGRERWWRETRYSVRTKRGRLLMLPETVEGGFHVVALNRLEMPDVASVI